jgi:hypothetical protein
MSWTFTTSGSAILSAGANANSTAIVSGSLLQSFSDDAEGYICAQTHKDWITNFASLDVGIKQALASAANCYIGNKLINYDMGGFTSRLEAENMLDVNFDLLQSLIGVLKDMKTNKLLAVP